MGRSIPSLNSELLEELAMTHQFFDSRLHVALLLGAATCFATAARADDVACKPVMDAMVKYLTTPSHAFVTTTGLATGGKPVKSETISTGTTQFFMFEGKWKRSRVTVQDLLDIEKDNAKRAKCHIVRAESVASEPATLFAVHIDADVGNADEQLWISRRSGLPLRMDVDVRVDGDKVANHSSETMTYGNIQAPQVASP
jgi:hypothetical protein